MPTLYLLGGPNGAGKTTFAREFLPIMMEKPVFHNPNEMARGLSPLNPDDAQIAAGRLLLERVAESIHKRESFALKSTLSGRTHLKILRKAREAGLRIVVVYLFIESAGQSAKRVASRVVKGGHNVPADAIQRRYQKSLDNLFSIYLPAADAWTIWDSQQIKRTVLATNDAHSMITAKKMIEEGQVEGPQGEIREEASLNMTEFLQIAQEAMDRASRAILEEHMRWGLPLIAVKDGEVVEQWPSYDLLKEL